MKKPIKVFVLAILLVCSLIFPSLTNSNLAMAKSNNDGLNITAKSAILIDYNSGKVLYEKSPNERLPIASMTKLATLAVVFDSIDKGIVKENDMVQVSKTAAATGGSSAFLDASSKYKVCELIKSVIIASANDSSVALSEHIAGSEELFVEKMNKMVASLGLSNTHFSNSTGLPIDNHYSSAFDISQIYKSICNHELYKRYSKVWMDDFVHPSGRKTGLVNTNKLIKSYEGIEGGKTGFTNSARFCLTASAARGNMRVIAVVIGVNDSKTRFAEMTKLFNFAFANYDTVLMANKDVPLTISAVKKSEKQVEVFPKETVSILTEKTKNKKYTMDFKLDEIVAPIKANSVVGKLFVFDENNMVVFETDIIVKDEVLEIGLKERFNKLIKFW